MFSCKSVCVCVCLSNFVKCMCVCVRMLLRVCVSFRVFLCEGDCMPVFCLLEFVLRNLCVRVSV